METKLNRAHVWQKSGGTTKSGDPDSNSSVTSDSAREKQELPIVSTDEGMQNLVRLVQW
jgi:hypothetical protein